MKPGYTAILVTDNMHSHKRCYILLLNWQEWESSIICLESLLRQDFSPYTILLCDNGSPNQSLNKIKAWADGLLQPPHISNNGLEQLYSPPLQKPIPYIECSKEELDNLVFDKEKFSVVLVQNNENLGCAKGYNVAIRYAIKQTDCASIWILNNDAVVDKKALHFLVQKLESNSKYGMVGSTIRFFEEPSTLQALGGARYNYWLGTGDPIGYKTSIEKSMHCSEEEIEAKLDYILGASMLISKKFIEKVGLMPDHFFLYFEEIAWVQNSGKSFNLGFASKSIVYHKQGQSTGFGEQVKKYGGLSDMLLHKNRIVFTKLYCQDKLLTVYLGLIWVLLESIFMLRWKRVGMFLKPSFWY